MATVATRQGVELSREFLQAFNNLSGDQPGYRATHAKGILLSGTFKPFYQGRSLTRAAHIQRDVTPVWVRFSDFGGVPSIPDSSPDASPRGMAIRFRLAEHEHTDIVAHSVNGFPARTAEEFLAFLQAAYQSASSVAKPTPIEAFLASHPAALRFVQMPKPMPVSFAKEAFFAVSAYCFANNDGDLQFGRYQILPEGGMECFSDCDAVAKEPDYLRHEISERLKAGPVKFVLAVQLAGADDIVDDATIDWPCERPVAKLGTLVIDGVVPDNEAEQRHIIFDPIARLDGIAPSGDPLFEPRADLYLMSGRRRRCAATQVL